MKKLTLALIVSAGLLPALTYADLLVVNPADITFASANTDQNDPGTITRGNTDQVEARSRVQSQLINGENRSVATFANFNISLVPSGSTINSATLTVTYDSQLNNVNSSGPASVGAVATAWDNSGSNDPLYLYGWNYTNGTTAALNTQVLVADIQNTAPTGAEVSADFTSTVAGWHSGSLDNNGLVFFIDGDGSQGAGFNNVELTIDYTIPEPSTIGLVAIMGGGLLIARRRFKM